MYKIEPHLHTTHVSRCGRLEAKEIVAGYKAAGYSALIVTDHFNRTFKKRTGLTPSDFKKAGLDNRERLLYN